MLGEYGGGTRSAGLDKGSQGPPSRETTRSCSEVRQRREGAAENRDEGARVESREDCGRVDGVVGRGGGGARDEAVEERAKMEWRRERGGAGAAVVVAVTAVVS